MAVQEGVFFGLCRRLTGKNLCIMAAGNCALQARLGYMR